MKAMETRLNERMRRHHKRLGSISDHLATSARGTVASRVEAVEAEEAEAIRRYHAIGAARAKQLGNRGPLRLDADGRVAQDIIESYYQHGFYVLEGVVKGEELVDLRDEFERLLDNAPAGSDDKPWKSSVDRHGRAVEHPGAYSFASPLSDPQGESPFGVFDFKKGQRGNPRHPLKMRQPAPSVLGPAAVVQNIVRPLRYLDGALHLYGHPGLLAVAEALNGPDFTPFTESSFYKAAGLGTSTAWHQDPSSAWDDEWAAGQLPVGHCGTSFHASIYSCTPENALWIVPGSHVHGRADIKAMSAAAGGTDRLEGAVPILCKPGDVYLQNRMVRRILQQT
jgi:hypothetical protein